MPALKQGNQGATAPLAEDCRACDVLAALCQLSSPGPRWRRFWAAGLYGRNTPRLGVARPGSPGRGCGAFLLSGPHHPTAQVRSHGSGLPAGAGERRVCWRLEQNADFPRAAARTAKARFQRQSRDRPCPGRADQRGPPARLRDVWAPATRNGRLLYKFSVTSSQTSPARPARSALAE
jgi:hypothetical protein